MLIMPMTEAALAAQIVAQAADPAAGGSPFSSIWMMVIIIAIFWFLVIAPQRKELKDKDKMRSGVKKGDAVVTAGGAHGQVVSVEKDTVTVRLAEKVNVVFERTAIARVVGGSSSETGDAKK